MIIKWVSRPNREKYAYKHTCPFILLPYFVTYPLNSLLIFLEQFCHPHPNELDHCAVLCINIQNSITQIRHIRNSSSSIYEIINYSKSNIRKFSISWNTIWSSIYETTPPTVLASRSVKNRLLCHFHFEDCQILIFRKSENKSNDWPYTGWPLSSGTSLFRPVV